MDEISECYRILDIEPGASLEDVKRSYRELVKVWHPDRFRGDSKLQAKAEEKLKRINIAYDRVVYEAAAAAGRSAVHPQPSRAEPPHSRPQSRATQAQAYRKPRSHATSSGPMNGRYLWLFRRLLRLMMIGWPLTLLVFVAILVGFLDRNSQNGSSTQPLASIADKQKDLRQLLDKENETTRKTQEALDRLGEVIEADVKSQYRAEEAATLARWKAQGDLAGTRVNPSVANATAPQLDKQRDDAILHHLLSDDRPASGSLLVDQLTKYSGKGKLMLDNGLAEDAYVKVVLNAKLVAAFYVRSHTKYTYSTIPDGSYLVLYCTGYGWDANIRNFTRGRHARSYDMPLIYSTSRVSDSTGVTISTDVVTLTLHKVVAGNAKTSDASLEEFDRY